MGPSPSSTGTVCPKVVLIGASMDLTAWALMVFLSLAFGAVLMMAVLSLTRGDGGK